MNLDPTKTILGLLTPVIAAASAWLCAAAAKHGMNLDPAGVNALAIAGATAGVAIGVKLIHDVEGTKQAKSVVAVAGGVDAALVAADPRANQQLEDALAQVTAAAEAKFAELEARIPQPPAPVVAAPAPAGPPPAVA